MEVKQIVIVIDFGTSNSGCLIEYYNKGVSAEGHLINRMPPRSGYDYAKQPTFLVIHKKSFDSIYHNGLDMDRVDNEISNGNIVFGADAYSKYLEDINDDDYINWACFDSIKMNLYDPNNCKVSDVSGNEYDLIDIISIYIRCLKNSALGWLKNARQNYLESQIQWVITIPAVWNDVSKKKMEIVNEKVFGKDISKVLEPEGAAINICMQQKSLELKTGDKFLVVDCGGGTTDIVGVEIKKDDKEKLYTEELIRSVGIPIAGEKIDSAFWRYFAETICNNVPEYQCLPPTRKVKDLILNYWQVNPKQKKKMMDKWLAIKHNYDFSKTTGSINFEPTNEYLFWLHKNHSLLYDANMNPNGFGMITKLDRKKMLEEVFLPTFNEIIEITKQSIEELTNKGGSFDYIFFAGGMSLMTKLSAMMIETIGGTNKVFCADSHEASRFVCGGSILYGASYMHINDIMLRRKSKLFYYTDYSVKTPNQSYDDLVEMFSRLYNLSNSRVKELLNNERFLFNSHKICGEYYCSCLFPICKSNETYENYNGSFHPIDPSANEFVSRIWSSEDLTFLPGDIKDTKSKSNKIHFEGKIEGKYDKRKEINIKIDFNKIAENSYFIVEYYLPSGEKIGELKIDRVETIIGH